MDPEETARHYQFLLQRWEDIIRTISGGNPPSRKEWRDTSEILKILNQVAAAKDANHMFLPGGGGLDLTWSKPGHEPRTIELNCGGLTDLVIPKRLTFENLDDGNPHGMYYYLEIEGLSPVIENASTGLGREEVTELFPGKYAPRWAFDAGYYDHDESGDEIPLPDSARVVSRYFKGNFAIFSKGSYYNRHSATYDGRHDVGRDPFRTLVARDYLAAPAGIA